MTSKTAMDGRPEIIGIGEVLWDILPSGKLLGGAPFNFAFQCGQLGYASEMMTRIGTDALGDEVLERMRQLGVPQRLVQRDPDHVTGSVLVEVDSAGQPSYLFAADTAYDHLAWSDEMATALAHAKAICFGTLAQRSPVSQATILRAVEYAKTAIKVFDINLRQNFFSRATLERSLSLCDWVKLNDSELCVMKHMFSIAGETEAATATHLLRHFDLDLVALTLGDRGCLVLTRDGQEIAISGHAVQVVDTIGAGDAFTAGLLVSFLSGQSVEESARFGNALAACVAMQAGATPIIDREAILTLLRA